MIPKIIHYCWFGKGLMPKSQQDCIKGWKKLMPDYQIMRWDESNFDYTRYKASKYAYQEKKYALVSDVCRYNVLSEYGGIYLDTDVEVFQRYDRFLDCNFFSAIEFFPDQFEKEGKEQIDSEGNPLIPGSEVANFEMLTSTLACAPQQEMIVALRDFYNSIDADAEYARNYRDYVDNDRLVARHCADRGFRYINETQHFSDGMVVYQTGIFGYKSCPGNKFEVSYHYNAATWRKKDEIPRAERRRLMFDKLGLLPLYEKYKAAKRWLRKLISKR